MRVAVISVVVGAGIAAPTAVAEEAAEPTQLVYVEAGGKAGLYGLGYERALAWRLSIGVAASVAVVRDQQIYSVSPYLHAPLVGGRRHKMFGELGAAFVHSRIPSPVEDWDGMTDSGAGGFASLGWERIGDRVVVRVAGSLVAGEGGLAPWMGIAVGARL